MALECRVYAEVLNTANLRFLETGEPQEVITVVSNGELVLVIHYCRGDRDMDQNGWTIYRFASDELYRDHLPYLNEQLGVRFGEESTSSTQEATCNN
jgi:hypothetical protein